MTTTLIASIASLYRDRSELDDEANDAVAARIRNLEFTLLLALRDDEHALASILATEVRRMRERFSPMVESLLSGSAAGLWRIH